MGDPGASAVRRLLGRERLTSTKTFQIVTLIFPRGKRRRAHLPAVPTSGPPLRSLFSTVAVVRSCMPHAYYIHRTYIKPTSARDQFEATVLVRGGVSRQDA